MILRPDRKGSDPKERALWGDLMSLGMVFPIAIVLGWFLGKWIGGKLGHPEAGSLIGLFWGVATGFYELYKVTMRMNKKAETSDSSESSKSSEKSEIGNRKSKIDDNGEGPDAHA